MSGASVGRGGGGPLRHSLGINSMKLRITRGAVLALIAAGVMSLVAAYLLLWTISSSSLAFVDCNGTYAFFATNPRCRIPAWTSTAFAVAAIGGLASLAASVVLFIRSRHRPPHDESDA